MSTFTRVTDLIKENFDESWLTESQRSTFEKIDGARGPGRGAVLNVHGKFGAGKTFLGWVLARMWKCGYYKDVDSIPIGSDFAVIDDFDSSREYGRWVMNRMKLREIAQVVALSDNRIRDDVWSEELELNAEDLAVVRSNLFRIDLVAPEGNYENLWELVSACEVKR